MSRKAELIGSHFPTIYLTVISLLQGIALSQLVPILIVYLEIADQPFLDIHILPLALMLLIIFIVWHHYAIGIFFLRWFPNIMDTIIPFFVSIGQFVLISYLTIGSAVTDIKLDEWSVGFAIFLFMGSGAYLSAALRMESDLFHNLMNAQAAIEHCKKTKKYFLLAAFSIMAQGLFGFLIVFLGNDRLLILSLVFLLAHLILFEYFLLRFIKPNFIHAMDEFEIEENKRK